MDDQVTYREMPHLVGAMLFLVVVVGPILLAAKVLYAVSEALSMVASRLIAWAEPGATGRGE